MTATSEECVRIGVLSDTHGFLDPLVPAAFAGVRHIIHAGDIVDPATLVALEAIAPVTAVAGNLDAGKLAKLPREVAGEAGGVTFVVGHKRKRLLKRLAAGRIDGVSSGAAVRLVVFGHEHVPSLEWLDGTLSLNPGTATSPHGEDDDPSVAIVESRGARLRVRFVLMPRRTRAAD